MLALLLGVVGAILCGVLSYAQLQSILHQRADHVRFKRLVDSGAVQLERQAAERELKRLRNPKVTDPSGWQSPIDEHDIKTVTWGKNYSVTSIETQDGQTLYPTAAPSVWSFLLIPVLPMIGFLIPWGGVRAIGWALAGFVHG